MVKHVVIFNVDPSVSEDELLRMARQGKEVLSQIPGVVNVTFGISPAAAPQYRYAFIIDFADESVIDFYRDHPLHVKFADEVFRPMTRGRITTDYKMVV